MEGRLDAALFGRAALPADDEAVVPDMVPFGEGAGGDMGHSYIQNLSQFFHSCHVLSLVRH